MTNMVTQKSKSILQCHQRMTLILFVIIVLILLSAVCGQATATTDEAAFQQECVDYYLDDASSNRALQEQEYYESNTLVTPTQGRSTPSKQFHLRSMAKFKTNSNNNQRLLRVAAATEETCELIIAEFDSILSENTETGTNSPVLGAPGERDAFHEWFSEAIWDGVVSVLSQANLTETIPSFDMFVDDYMEMFYASMTNDDLWALSMENNSTETEIRAPGAIDSETAECAVFMVDAYIETFLFVLSLMVMHSPPALQKTLRRFFNDNGDRIAKKLIPAIKAAQKIDNILLGSSSASSSSSSGKSLTTMAMKSLTLEVFRTFFTTFSTKEVMRELWADRREIGFGVILSLGIEFAAVGASGGTILLVKFAKLGQVLLDSKSLVEAWTKALTECNEIDIEGYDDDDDDNCDNCNKGESGDDKWSRILPIVVGALVGVVLCVCCALFAG